MSVSDAELALAKVKLKKVLEVHKDLSVAAQEHVFACLLGKESPVVASQKDHDRLHDELEKLGGKVHNGLKSGVNDSKASQSRKAPARDREDSHGHRKAGT